MRIDKLIEQLAQYPAYYEVQVGSAFVTEVHAETHIHKARRPGQHHLDGPIIGASVVVVIA